METALITVLLLTGLSHTDAFTLTVLDRAISWLSIVAVGGVVFLAMTVKRSKNTETGKVEEATPGGS